MTRADHLDPHAPRVVNVRRDRANCATRDARGRLRPQISRQVFDQIHRDAIVRAPCIDQRSSVFSIFWHTRFLVLLCAFVAS